MVILFVSKQVFCITLIGKRYTPWRSVLPVSGFKCVCLGRTVQGKTLNMLIKNNWVCFEFDIDYESIKSDNVCVKFLKNLTNNLRKEGDAMSMNVVSKIDDFVKVTHVLASVFDKTGLDEFIPELLRINPEIRIFSTGGTYKKIKEILGAKAESCLTQVSDYTGQPETQGGLVKTLDFKIYLGLLTETYNDAHNDDIKRTGSVHIDMVIGNLYPFRDTISQPHVTVEQARGNIDIGGPCMIRASAKNYIRVASVVDPSDYESILSEMRANHGSISLELRFRLAQKAFEYTAVYDRTIADFLGSRAIEDVTECYEY
jgi:phosphoribosylaminoimidazolecarboxamide formyltransferase/IMP cyclohydrolase